jgi:polysaccharide biosynthesis/export protein
MKKGITFYCIVFFSVLFLVSCRSSEELTMFADLQNDTRLLQMPGTAPEYRIKPFDNLYISVLSLDPEVNQLFNPHMGGGGGYGTGTQQMFGDRASQYINGYMVDETGNISMPIIGKIEVTGLNLYEAQGKITSRAEAYLKDPNVKVKVLNFKVNVTGEVRNPGLYYNYEGSLNIIDAISMANGITEFADLGHVLVLRHDDNETRTYNLNLRDHSVYSSDAFYLHPDDIVYIQPNKFKRYRENTNIYSLILSTVSTILVATTVFFNNFYNQ